MKISSFCIQHFRSLIDSGWKNFSNDNITVLIGQNESGKTTILEALNSFYTGEIHEDVLRSDLTLPSVSCHFQLETESIDQILQLDKLPLEVQESFINSQSICLTRIWDDLYTSRVVVDDKVITEYFDEHKKAKADTIEQTQNNLKKIASRYLETKEQYKTLFEQKSTNDAQLNELASLINNKKKQLSRTKKEARKQKYTSEIKELETQYNELQQKQNKVKSKCSELHERLQLEELIWKISQKTEQIQQEYTDLTSDTETTYKEIREAESALGIIASEKERKATIAKLETTKIKYVETIQQINKKNKEFEYWIMVAEKVINGEKQENAEKEVHAYQQQQEKYYTPEELGALFFEKIPEFEFFHDFSSLLPDKIDLEDIILQRTHVKGYKAVRNYLKIADLKPEFFDQKNSRILKQKIEKLNHEITLDFHAYWRQSVGKDNKINISFELEHYDHNTPEKVGKPYIEFWIKDKDERLYPKQRSRGVRWFLSFYLELKAYAMKNQKTRVLLIDEPAMSLHARAQEDVLKVFEDIKTHLQIIYTTHSPHLINENKLYRVLAIQRANESEYSESMIYEPGSLKTASSDTLSPIYVLMGSRLNAQEFIHKENNIILEDLPTYFYLMAISKIAGLKKKLHFIPATNTGNVATMANLLMGWKLGYTIILGNTEESQQVYEYFKSNLFQGNEQKTRETILRLPDGNRRIEDNFSTLDFKKYILNQRRGITESNSDFIEHNNLSRSMLASSFLSRVQNEHLSLENFDDETNENFKELLNGLFDILKTETINQLYS